MAVRVYGIVQGVGFRYHATYIASRIGVSGWVRNLYDGRVEMEVQGTPEEVAKFPKSYTGKYLREKLK